MTDEVKTPTGAEIEAGMLQKEATRAPDHPLDTHAGFFELYTPVFERGLAQLGKKSLARVMKLLITYPLENEHLKALNDAERNLLKIGDQLLVSKYMMIIHTAGEQMLKAETQEKEKENGTENKNS